MTDTDWEALLAPEAQRFLHEHADENAARICLEHAARSRLPVGPLCTQIELRRRARHKLPTLIERGLLLQSLPLEQSSSEATARHKSRLLTGRRLIDLTGGLGIDTIHLASRFDEVVYCEHNADSAALFRVNARILGIDNVTIRAADGIEVLREYPDGWFSWVYADPSRRDGAGRHVALEHCRPDLTKVMDLLMAKGERICIKASPALEITSVQRLSGLMEVRVISVDGECRELLLILGASGANSPRVYAELLDGSGQSVFTAEGAVSNRRDREPCGPVMEHFFDPDAAIVKAGLAPVVARRFSLSFVNSAVDYLTGADPTHGFPGRVFRVCAVIPWSRAGVRTYLHESGIRGASIARRDFAIDPVQLRAMLSLGESDREYLFFTRDHRMRPTCIHARRI